MVCTDDSEGLGYTTFTVDGITYESMDGNDIRAVRIDSEAGRDIIIPSSLTYGGRTYTVRSLGEELSAYWDIDSIHIPETVVEIIPGALSSPDLEAISVDAANPVYVVVGKALYDNVRSSLVRYCPNNSDVVFEIPGHVITIEAYAFYYASNLEEIRNIPNSIKVIDKFTFSGCSSLSKINYSVLKGVNILPEGLIYIGRSAFSLCESLDNIVLPKSLIMLDAFAFSYNSLLRTIEIQENVNYIGDSVFHGCDSLESIIVSPLNSFYLSLDGVLFLEEGNPKALTLVHYPSMKSDTSYVLPSNSNNIQSGAFYGVTNLKEVTFNDNFIVIPVGALLGASSVEKVFLPSTTVLIDTIAFSDCTSLTAIVGGESVVTINGWAFENTNLSMPFIPNSVTTIGHYAFYGCNGFVDITIPSTVTSVGSYVFKNCSNIKSITFDGTDTVLSSDSLSIGSEESPATVTVYFHGGFTIPSDVSDGFTELDLVELGKEPYPWVNLIGVAVCLLILFGMFRLFREV